jgi:hypothetical protein
LKGVEASPMNEIIIIFKSLLPSNKLPESKLDQRIPKN